MPNDITVRDYFAAKAMQSLITARAALGPDHEESFENHVTAGMSASWHWLSDEDGTPMSFAAATACDAYEIADAMLKRRQQKIEKE